MATKTFTERKFLIKAADTITIGPPFDAVAGTMSIMLVASGGGSAWSGSITVKAISSAPEAAAETPLPVQYSSRYLNGAISTDSLGSAAITTTSLILVPATGQTIVLDCTSYTSGTMTVYAVPCAGAAV